MDESFLTAEVVRTLSIAAPTAEDEELLRGFEGDPASLRSVERFMLRLLDVPGIRERLAALATRTKFRDLALETRDVVASLSLACTEVLESVSLAAEAVAIGRRWWWWWLW